MSRHTFMVVYADRAADGRAFRVRTYVEADSADGARAMFHAVKVVRVKAVKS